MVRNLYQHWQRILLGFGSTATPKQTAHAPGTDHGFHHELAARFEEQKEVLFSVSRDTEQEFISFGKESEVLFSNTKVILADVHSILDTATGNDAKEAIDLFNVLVRDAEKLITADETDLDSLMQEMSDLRRQIDTLLRHRESIDGAMRLPLELLKVGFRIEGANQHQKMAKIMESVAIEVSILGEKLVRSTDEQFEGLDTAIHEIDKLVSRLRNMNEEAHRQYGEAADRIHELQANARQLSDARLVQGEVGQAIEVNGRDLQQQFNRVVMALQYHDITRQQLEHVAQAFGTIQEWIPSGQDSAQKSLTGGEAALLHQAVSVQIQQTDAALGSLKTAGREFQEGMEAVSGRVNDLAQNVAVFNGLRQTDKVFKALEGLSSLQSLIATRSAIKRDVGEAGCLIYGRVTDCTTTIGELTTDLRILAINAQVQAVNAGKQRVIEVLAENICQVSAAIQTATESLTADMRTIKDRLSELAARAWKMGTHQTPEARAVSEGAPRCIALLRGFQGNLTAGLEDLSRRQKDLQSRIEYLLTKVSFPEIASQQLQTVLRFFQEVQVQTSPLADHADISKHAIASLEASYTMVKEREVHALAIAQSHRTVATQDSDEYPAPPDVSQKKPERATAAAQEFGDNIELF